METLILYIIKLITYPLPSPYLVQFLQNFIEVHLLSTDSFETIWNSEWIRNPSNLNSFIDLNREKGTTWNKWLIENPMVYMLD